MGLRWQYASAGGLYTAADRISAAQQALAQQNYYRGPISGQLDDDTRRALFQYQVDRGLSATGNLDGRTAQALGINVAAGGSGSTDGSTPSGSVFTTAQASAVRRDAQTMVSRYRSELTASGVGRLDPARAYAQDDLDLWFALSAFADNASIYEQIVTSGTNRDGAVLAGHALVNAARRVDSAIPAARSSAQLQNAWNTLRRQLNMIDTSY